MTQATRSIENLARAVRRELAADLMVARHEGASGVAALRREVVTRMASLAGKPRPEVARQLSDYLARTDEPNAEALGELAFRLRLAERLPKAHRGQALTQPPFDAPRD